VPLGRHLVIFCGSAIQVCVIPVAGSVWNCQEAVVTCPHRGTGIRSHLALSGHAKAAAGEG